jgi:ubiquinone biosynthesis protein UbiJ
MEIAAFELILITIVAVVLIKAGTRVMLPISKHLAELMGETVREKRSARQPGPQGGDVERVAQALDRLDRRLDRLEERLDFVEELRSPGSRSQIGTG